jgi:hypothetical protein
MKKSTFLLALFLLTASISAMAGPLNCPRLSSGALIRPENRYFEVLPRVVPANGNSPWKSCPCTAMCSSRKAAAMNSPIRPCFRCRTRALGGWDQTEIGPGKRADPHHGVL